MKLPLSKIEKSRSLIAFSKKLKIVNIAFLISVLILIISVSLMHTVFKNYTAPENSQSILAPVALILTEDGSGTGFLSGPTTIITARHVVDNIEVGDEVTVSFEKAKPKIDCLAKLVWKDSSTPYNPEHDFAVLKIINSTIPDNMPVFDLGSAYNVSEGNKIKAIGYPGGLFSITEGSLSNTQVDYNDEEYELLQLDCNIYPGNSGGPIILSETNEVIGIAIFGFTDDFKGMNYAAYIDYIIDQLDGTEIDLFE